MPRAGADFSGKVYKNGDLECKAGIQLLRKQVTLYCFSAPLHPLLPVPQRIRASARRINLQQLFRIQRPKNDPLLYLHSAYILVKNEISV